MQTVRLTGGDRSGRPPTPNDGRLFPHCQAGDHHLFVGLWRVVPETVETSSDSDEPSVAGVVRQQVPTESGNLSLRSREVAKLLRGRGKEPGMIRMLSIIVAHMEHYIQLIGDYALEWRGVRPVQI
jgi:hypothetical protein